MNKKAIQLIEKMIEEDDYQTVSFFALGLNVSTRTIFNYLEFIEEELKDSDLYVHKVQGRGIRLIGSQKDKIDLLHSLNGVEVLSTLERQLIIIQKLILEEQTLTYQKLSDYFMARLLMVFIRYFMNLLVSISFMFLISIQGVCS